MANQRPISVSIVAWYTLLSSALSIATSVTFYRTPEFHDAFEQIGVSLQLLTISSVISAIIVIIFGAAMLKGLNWARIGYLIYYPATTIALWQMFDLDSTHLNGLFIYLVILFILTRPSAKNFFNG